MNPYAIAIKYGLIALGIVALCVGLVFYGMHRKQLEWDASLMQQAIQSAESMVAQAENTAKVEVRYIKVKGETEIRTQLVEKEVIRYVETPSQKCQLTPEFERAFDLVSRLHDPSAVSLPASESSAGDLAQSSDTRLTDVEILRAYEHATVQLHELWNTYAALVEWVRTSHELYHDSVNRPILE